MHTHIEKEIEFGYIVEEKFQLQGAFPVRVNTPCPHRFLDKLKETDGWCYALSVKRRIFGQKPNCTMSGVLSKEHGRFMIQCLSFLYGQKLFTLPCEYVDSVQLKRDHFGLFISNEDIEKGLIYCNELWMKEAAEDKTEFSRLLKRVFGIIHLLFMSTSKTNLQFEQFIYIYIALDASFKHFCDMGLIPHNGKGVPHKQRLKMISDIAGINFSQALSEQYFYQIRNDVFHEGLYLEEPLGYKAKGGKHNLSFAQNFLIHVIFVVLGIKATGFPESVDTLNSTRITIE